MMNSHRNRPLRAHDVLYRQAANSSLRDTTKLFPCSMQAVPYEEYAAKLQAEIDAARTDWVDGTAKIFLIAVVPSFVILILVILTSLMTVPGSIIYWIGKALLFFTLIVILIRCIFQPKQTIRMIIDGCISSPSIDCPHCKCGIDLTQEWRCGWCDVVNNGNMLLAPSLVFDGCSHKGKHRPSAILCSHCGNHVICDIKTYKEINASGNIDSNGVAEFLGGQ